MDRLLDGKTGLFTYYEYDPAGRVRLQHHPNATATYFIYDAAGRLSEKVTRKDADASVLVRFAYTRDAAGNPNCIEREAALGAFYYAYDQLQRLAYEGQFISDEREYENYYEYDPAGNRTLLRHGETDAENLTYYAYDAANELTALHDAAGWTYFSYDANGNTVMEQTPAYTRYFDWDGRDMLTGVRSTEQGWTDNVYRYDGLASRVSTLESGGLTYYDWDSINVVQEKDGDGEVTDRQVHGHAPIFSVGDIALMDKSGTPYVPVSDQPGTTWDLLDSSAAKANSYAYDAFGVARSVSEAVSNLYRFRADRRAADLPMYLVPRLAYDPGKGCTLGSSSRGSSTTIRTIVSPKNSLAPAAKVPPSKPVPRDWDTEPIDCPEQVQQWKQQALESANYIEDKGTASCVQGALQDMQIYCRRASSKTPCGLMHKGEVRRDEANVTIWLMEDGTTGPCGGCEGEKYLLLHEAAHICLKRHCRQGLPGANHECFAYACETEAFNRWRQKELESRQKDENDEPCPEPLPPECNAPWEYRRDECTRKRLGHYAVCILPARDQSGNCP
jgi:YD repeat-containing protein